MKNLDVKKLLVFIVIIAIVGVIAFFVIKSMSNTKPTEEERKLAEKLTTEHVVNFTNGYITSYNGIDYLFQFDKVTYDDLEVGPIIRSAIAYAKENDISINVSTTTINNLGATNEYGDIKAYEIYSGEGIRKSIKALYGKDFENKSETNSLNFMYDIIYNIKYDSYLVKRNSAISNTNPAQTVKYNIIETNKKDDKLTTTIAISYVYDDGQEQMISTDRNGDNVILEGVVEVPTENIKDFDKYDVTFTKVDDKYVFESIEKVK